MLKSLSVFLLLLIAAALGFVYWAMEPISNRAHEFSIKQGSSLRSSTEQIASAGVPINPWLLELLARFTGQQNKIKAGAYLAEADITPQALLKKMVRGEFQQFSLTLIEGWTFKQMRAAILRHP